MVDVNIDVFFSQLQANALLFNQARKAGRVAWLADQGQHDLHSSSCLKSQCLVPPEPPCEAAWETANHEPFVLVASPTDFFITLSQVVNQEFGQAFLTNYFYLLKDQLLMYSPKQKKWNHGSRAVSSFVGFRSLPNCNWAIPNPIDDPQT